MTQRYKDSNNQRDNEALQFICKIFLKLVAEVIGKFFKQQVIIKIGEMYASMKFTRF